MEKYAELPLAARLAASVLGYTHDKNHQAKLLAEAEAMNLLAREAEARRMAPVLRGLERHSELAEKMGSSLAKLAAHDKEAFGAALAGLGRMAVGGVGKAMSSLGRGASQGFTGTGRLLNAAKSETQQFQQALRPGARQRIGGALQSAGQRMQSAAAAAPIPKPQAAVTGAAGKGKSLLGMGTKAKLLGGAAIAGVGYAGYKGLQGARDYMMQPAAQGQQFGYGISPKAGPNEYGY